MRSSLKTVVSASWASSMIGTGAPSVLAMCSPQRWRRAFEAGPAIVAGQRHAQDVSQLAVEVHGATLRSADARLDILSTIRSRYAEGTFVLATLSWRRRLTTLGQ
jgi:hypothetical protein